MRCKKITILLATVIFIVGCIALETMRTPTSHRPEWSDASNVPAFRGKANRSGTLHLEDVSFGTVEAGGKRLAVTWLHNESDTIAEIPELAAKCGCTTVHISETDVAARSKVPVLIVLDLKDDPQYEGNLSVAIVSLDQTSECPAVGNVWACVTADRRVVEVVDLGTGFQ
jgi:hypothetical protein